MDVNRTLGDGTVDRGPVVALICDLAASYRRALAVPRSSGYVELNADTLDKLEAHVEALTRCRALPRHEAHVLLPIAPRDQPFRDRRGLRP
jgi:hypothetical protein